MIPVSKQPEQETYRLAVDIVGPSSEAKDWTEEFRTALVKWTDNYLLHDPLHSAEVEISKRLSTSPTEIAGVFHRCWGAAYASPDYDKKAWQKMQALLNEAGIRV